MRANADYPVDAERARRYGAEGIGLTRTEHMFFETERLPLVQKMIMTTSPDGAAEALAGLLPYQRADFEGLFRAMDGLPVIIRLIDPPLHEFLPSAEDLTKQLIDLKVAGGQGRRGGRRTSPRSRACSPGWRPCTRPTRCWAPAGCGWGS